MNYNELTPAQAKEEYAKTLAEYEAIKAKGLKLNMARGKPSKQQLDLVSDILTILSDPNECVDNGVESRNYCKPEQVFAGGNASLQLMYDTISKAYTHGLLHSERPWCKETGLKWLCPAPGYDRHFKITESFGFELITVPMTEEGPDMDKVEEYIKDPKVKGMWTVPKYSNPDEACRTGLPADVGQRLRHPRVHRRLCAVPRHAEHLRGARQRRHGV